MIHHPKNGKFHPRFGPTPYFLSYSLSVLPLSSKTLLKRRNMPSGSIPVFFLRPFLSLRKTFYNIWLRVEIAVECHRFSFGFVAANECQFGLHC
jgi:hypothetical protein